MLDKKYSIFSWLGWRDIFQLFEDDEDHSRLLLDDVGKEDEY